MITATRAGVAAPSLPRLPYQWRDPSRCTQARLAALEAHDRKFGPLLASPREGAPSQVQAARAAERRAEFAELRGQGWSVADAGAAVGIARNTANRYERRRLAGASP